MILSGVLKMWQPIDTAPKDGTLIIIYAPPTLYQEEGIYIASWKQIDFIVSRRSDPYAWCVICSYQDEQGGECTISNPTHWMPLPDKP